MTDKEKEAYNFFKKCNEKDLENFDYFSEPSKLQIKYMETVLNLIQTQQEDIEDYQRILDTFDKREYRKRYLEEERAKRPKLLYPDADEIYQRYYEQKAEIEKKDKIIDEMANAWADDFCCVSDTMSEEICNCAKCRYISVDGKSCNDCIKEYFINKVEKESKDE